MSRSIRWTPSASTAIGAVKKDRDEKHRWHRRWRPQERVALRVTPVAVLDAYIPTSNRQIQQVDTKRGRGRFFRPVHWMGEADAMGMPGQTTSRGYATQDVSGG